MIRKATILLLIALMLVAAAPVQAFAASPAHGETSQMGYIWGVWSSWVDFDVYGYYTSATTTTWRVTKVSARTYTSHMLNTYIDNCYAEVRQSGTPVLNLYSSGHTHTINLSAYTHNWDGLSKSVAKGKATVYNFQRYRYPGGSGFSLVEGTKAYSTNQF